MIFEHLALETPNLLGAEVDLDESYFGGTRKGKRGLGASGEVSIFGLFKRHGRVYVAIIPNVSSATLFPIIPDKIASDSDGLRSNDMLNVADFHHVPIKQSELFADKTSHVNGIENCWN